MRNNSSLDILMATYNGASYIEAQIDSLLLQTVQDWQLLIRDDGSDDETRRIILRYREQHPDKIAMIEDGNLNLGAKANFTKLLTHSRANHVMLCDQDDVWLPHKIEATIAAMKHLESEIGHVVPALVHTDAKIVDENLQDIFPSLWRYQKSDPVKGSTLRRLLLQNVATGCTIMVNRALLEKALPVPDEAMMHDWWLVLVAAAFGRIEYIPKATVLYRQHGKNDIGAKQWNMQAVFHYLRDLPNTLRYIKQVNLKAQQQAAVFLEHYEKTLRSSDREMLDAYAHLSRRNYFKRRYLFIEYGFFYTNLIRNIGRMLFA